MARNPLDAAQQLLSKYREKLHFTLVGNNLAPETVNQILDSMQIDSGIYLSKNPRYEQSGEPFADFLHQQSLPDALVYTMPKLAEHGLYTHQRQGILSILEGNHTIISTGTGSGKTETFLIPILAHCLQSNRRGIKAIIIYPMNALASDQVERLGKYTQDTNVTFGLYTGATPESALYEHIERSFTNQLIYRDEIRANPPDILITNYVMLDRMLTREKDHPIFIESAETLRYIVLDELHTYTGSKATHLKYLLARLKHYWTSDPVYIGTSATLISNEAGRSRLDTFLRSLFDIEHGDYTFVEAVEDTLHDVSIKPPLPFGSDELDQLDFSTDESAAKSIGVLTRQHIDVFDFYSAPEQFHKTVVFRSLLEDYYVDVIRRALANGAQSFNDLLRHISQAMPAEQFQAVSPEQLLSSYLGAITLLNEKAGERGKPLLDYRLHLFLRNLTGILKTCPTCHRYFSGDITHCSYDGQVLFAVYRHDTRLSVGKFNGQELSPTLEPESTDQKMVHYVLIGDMDSDMPAELEVCGKVTQNGRFEIQSDGTHRLVHLEAQHYEQLENDLIHLGDEKRDYLYLVHLVKLLLQTYGKSLGFVDNRELASRYSAVIRDEFASDFLFEFLRLNYPRLLDLDKTLAYLLKCAEEVATSDLEREVFSELIPWFYRMIAIPERMGGRADLLRLRDDILDPDIDTDLSSEILKIFVRERAIETEFADDSYSRQFIRFQRYWATTHYGVYLEDTVSEHPLYRGISLGKNSRIYADFVEKWTPEFIQEIVKQLVDQNILRQHFTPDDKAVYYLKREYLCFNLTQSSYGEGEDGYIRMKNDLLFRAEVHSSDLRAFERKNIEAGLKNDSVHFVAATPTLEMGIDIGDLENVLMIGAPPTPANYAQRAGRAGRGTKHDALITTFCFASSVHDIYAFRNPRTVIDGQVVPPTFNPANAEILKQHINAFVLRHYLKNRESLRQLECDLNSIYSDHIPRMQELFGTWFNYAQYMDEFATIASEVLGQTDGKRISLAHYCYQIGHLPDYSFRRDQVIAVDVEDRDKLDEEQIVDWRDYALANRDTEQAFRFFIPDQTIYIAGEIYKVLNDGIYTVLGDGARQYSCFYAEKELLYAQPHKEIKRLDLRQHFIADVFQLREVRGVIALGYSDHCVVSFRNHGMRQAPGSSTAEVHSPIGYDLSREAFILRFDSLICDESLRNSLTAVLVREFNRGYGLADGEIRLMQSAKLLGESKDSRWQYTIFYDNDGNKNLPLRHIPADFQSIVASAHSTLAECSCETDGCYNCIRSYSTQYFDQTLSKANALMFTGYLLGKNAFVPAVPPFTSLSATSFDLVLNVKQQNNIVLVTSSTGREYKQSTQNIPLNDAIFSALVRAIYSEYRESMKTLKIETWTDWLANAINNRSINKGKDVFNRFQFALLRFVHVEAVCVKERGKSLR